MVAYDARGHGDSDKPEDGYSWIAYRDDLVALASALPAQLGYERVDLAVGHSFGGAVAFMAAQQQPSLFGQLLLIEPILVRQAMIDAAGVSPDEPSPMAVAAARRRRVLPSREQARRSFAAAAAFVGVTAESLDDYLDHGYRTLEDGRLELKCPPQIEAATFSMGGVDGALTDQPVTLPIALQRGTRGWLPRELFEAFMPLMPAHTFEEVPAGHLVPMEIPSHTAESIRALLGVSTG